MNSRQKHGNKAKYVIGARTQNHVSNVKMQTKDENKAKI